MGLVKEPKDVDFFVVNKELTDKEKKEFSDFIENYKKAKALNKNKHRKAA